MTRSAAALVFALFSICCASSSTQTPEPPPLPKGQVALRLLALDGSTLTLGSLRGRVVLVTVMSTSAEIAMLEVPRLKEIAAKYPENELAIVCVMLDDQLAAIQVFIESFEIPYEVVVPEDPARLLGEDGPFGPIQVLPTSVLISRSGELAIRSTGLWPKGVLEEAIDRLLAEDPPNR